MKTLYALLLITFFLILGGCASTGDGDGDASVEDRDAAGATTGGYNDGGATSGAAMGGGVSGGPLNDPNSPLAVRTIYFEYDSSVISNEGMNTLVAHAEYLSLNPTTTIVVEGHTDERGTRDYNLALGERRARAVQEYLLANGVTSQQLDTRSYGEENPVNIEHNEAAWQMNRRVELIY